MVAAAAVGTAKPQAPRSARNYRFPYVATFIYVTLVDFKRGIRSATLLVCMYRTACVLDSYSELKFKHNHTKRVWYACFIFLLLVLG